MAAQEGYVEIIRLLVDAQADLNLQRVRGACGTRRSCGAAAEAWGAHLQEDGCSALIMAAAAGYVEIIRLLVDAQADLNLQRVRGAWGAR